MADAPQEVGTLEAVKVKLLVLGDDAAPSAVRVELTSENDLFFNYVHTLDDTGFLQVQEAQKLMVDFSEYPSVRHAHTHAHALACALALAPAPAPACAECLNLLVLPGTRGSARTTFTLHRTLALTLNPHHRF